MRFTANQWVAVILVAVVFLAAGFWLGSAYGHPLRAGFGVGQGAGPAGRPGTFNVSFEGRGTGGAPTVGTILSQDVNSITVATQGGGSRIVLVSASTTVMTQATSSVAALKTGEMVVVTGTTNSDGSVSAKSIQARP